MKNIVIGANGLLGKTLQEREYFQKDWVFLGKDLLDITNIQQIKNAIEHNNPKYILNCSAYTDVNKAEIERQLCYNINYSGVKNACMSISNPDTKFIHISTNFVFSGDNTQPYHEMDMCNPTNYYGMSKFMGEQAIMETLKNFLIIRTSWLFGHQSSTNMLFKLIKLLTNNKELSSPNDSYSIPTSSTSLAIAIENLLEVDAIGIYHYASNSPCSNFELLNEVNQNINSECIINPTTHSEFNESPPRPQYSVLSTLKYGKLFNNNENWKVRLKESISLIK